MNRDEGGYILTHVWDSLLAMPFSDHSVPKEGLRCWSKPISDSSDPIALPTLGKHENNS